MKMDKFSMFVLMGVALTVASIASQKVTRALESWWIAATKLHFMKAKSVRNTAFAGALLGALPAALADMPVWQGAVLGGCCMLGAVFSLLLQRSFRAYRADAGRWKLAVEGALKHIDTRPHVRSASK